MVVSKVQIECNNIKGWGSFHDEFDRVFGFPEFYGRNMNAWIDCLTYLDDPESGMTRIHCEAGQILTVELVNSNSLKNKWPELFDAIIECSAFVNERRVEAGESPVFALSY